MGQEICAQFKKITFFLNKQICARVGVGIVFITAGSQKWTKTAQRFEDRTDHTTPLEVPQSLYHVEM